MSCLLPLALLVCLTSEPAVGEPFFLHPGETADVVGTDFSVTFEEVRSDSRCPKDVQCVRAGEAVVVLGLRTGTGETSQVSLEVPPDGGGACAFGDYTIHIVALEPQTESGERIEPDAYVLELRVDA